MAGRAEALCGVAARNHMDMDKRLLLSTTLFQSAGPAAHDSSHRFNHRFNHLFTRIALWLGVLLLLAACGPGEAKPDSGQLRAETDRIAQEYSAGGSLDQAREAINALEVANPHQYLVIQAEEAIAANADPQTTSALVKLAVDMRLTSASIQNYATQNGLIAVAPTPTPLPTLDFGPAAVRAGRQVQRRRIHRRWLPPIGPAPSRCCRRPGQFPTSRWQRSCR